MGWVLVLITPYLFGFLIHDSSVKFLGFLINPVDGLSYLAKMNQGAHGEWLFHLPFSATAHPKVFLFSFYVLIGKVSALLFGDLRIGFHFFRLLSATYFYYELIQLMTVYFDSGILSLYLKISVLFGGGLGWLYLLSGDLPADLWVAEAFPFLSGFVNPHFILSLGILLYLLRVSVGLSTTTQAKMKLVFVAIVLVNISPFAVVLGGLVLLAAGVWDYYTLKRMQPWNLILFGLGSAPFLIYQYWVVNTIDALISWNAQNLTPAPSPLNLIFSFSPFLLANFFLVIVVIKKKVPLTKLQFILMGWVFVVLILIYLPLGLQRRFLVGFDLANSILFFCLIAALVKRDLYPFLKIKRWLLIIVILILPSNLLLLFGAVGATLQQDENLFRPVSLMQAYTWLDDFGLVDGVVLAKEYEGLSLPAFAAQRAVLGHPFETPDYETTSEAVLSFFEGQFMKPSTKLFEDYNVDYILVESEKLENLENYMQDLTLVYQNDAYLVFQVSE